MANNLLEILEQDCREWSSSFKELLMNERHMQVELAWHLKKSKHYDKVYVEYAVPLVMLGERGIEVPKYLNKKWTTPPDFPWFNQMYIDIVVERAGEFAAVELKYATTAIDTDLLVFDEETPDDINIIKSTAALDNTMYRYWKDVRRIEAFTRFSKVKGGVALIITNNKAYWEEPANNPVYSMFSIHEGNTVGGSLKWGKKNGEPCAMSKTHPVFNLKGSYKCGWGTTKIPVKSYNGSPFRFMITKVKKVR